MKEYQKDLIIKIIIRRYECNLSERKQGHLETEIPHWFFAPASSLCTTTGGMIKTQFITHRVHILIWILKNFDFEFHAAHTRCRIRLRQDRLFQNERRGAAAIQKHDACQA